MMWDSLYYENRGIFLQSIHTMVNLFYIAVLFTMVMVCNHPLYMISVFLIALVNLGLAGALKKGEKILQAGIWLTLLIMIVNPLVIHAGSTILWFGPELPLLGRIEISLEAISYGAAMGLRLMTLMIIFCLFNEIVNPDKLLSHMSRWAYKSGLIVSISTRLFPLISRQLKNVREAQQLRGVNFNSGGLRNRVRKYAWVFGVVLESTLDGSFKTAESMQARAFGTGPRSCYQRESWRPRDLLCLTASGLALGMLVYTKIRGFSNIDYYPNLGTFIKSISVINWLGGIMLCLAIPAVLSWLWKRSVLVRSKI